MTRGPLTAVLLTAALLAASAAGAASSRQVVVQDPYLEFRSGPGRGYPVFHVVDRGASVDLLRRRTDWIKVRSAGGEEGWVNRAQLERTLTPQGEAVALPGPAPASRTEHRWEASLATGDFGGASMVSAQAAWNFTPTLQARLDAAQLLGSYSDGWLVTAGIAHLFAPQWRVSPFVGIGGGLLRIDPKATIIRADERTEETAYLGAGLRGYLSNRFLLQAEYRSFVVFPDRDENEEIAAWTVAFTYFF